MHNSNKSLPPKKRTIWYWVGNIFSITVLSILIIAVLAIILIQTRPVQNYARIKIANYLEKKLKTRVEIGKIDIDFPNSVLLQNVYIEDQKKDTLLSGGEMRVDLDMFKLLQNEVKIGEIEFNNVYAKIRRLSPDTVFNFQFIVDAFATDQTKVSTKQDTTTLKMGIDRIFINNTRVIYTDVFTGNDMDLLIGHLDSKITRFDPAHLYFDVPEIHVRGLRGYFYQNEPLIPVIEKAVAEAVLTPGTVLQLENGVIALEDVDVNYRSAPTNISTHIKFNNLITHPERLNIREGLFDLKDITLDRSTIDVVMGAPVEKPVVTREEQIIKDILPPFTISSNELNIIESNFTLNNTTKPYTTYGMDYFHMDVKDINIKATNARYNLDTIAALINQASLTEKSGFVLKELNTDFLYTNDQIALRDLYIRTPGSILRRNAVMRFPSLAALAANPAVMTLDLDIESSSVLIRDLLTFAPQLRVLPAFSNPSQTWMVHGKVNGRMDNLVLTDFRLKGLTGTTLFASGRLTGLPDPDKFNADLNISYLNTTKRDLIGLMPPGTLPPNINLPASLTATGRLKAGINDLVTDLNIRSSMGSAKLKGSLLNYSDPKRASYDMNVIANSLNLYALMGNEMVKTISGNFKVKGTGFEPQTANATISGNISSAVINNYNYKNVNLVASIANGNYTAKATVIDPNIHLSINASGGFNGEFPSINFIADIDSIKTQPLNLTPQVLVYHGKVEGNLTNTNPDALSGSFLITNSVMVVEGQRMVLDSVRIFADNTNGNQLLRVQSDFLIAEISGRYKLTQLADIILQSVNPYFKLPMASNVRVDPYDFKITAHVFSHPAIKAFMPSLTSMDSINIAANFSSVNGWNADVSAPLVITDMFKLGGFKFNVTTNGNQLDFKSSYNQLKVGTQLSIYATDITGNIANNQINFAVGMKDAYGKNKYGFAALVTHPSVDNYTFQLKPEGLMLNYDTWSVNAGNSIVFEAGDIIANQFILSNRNQQLSLNSIGGGVNRPLSVDFTNFKIATLAAFVQSDSLLVNGTLNGNLLLKNYRTQPVFTADMAITDLAIYNDTVGNVIAKVNNNVANVYNADISLTGRGNDVTAKGNYYVRPDNNSSFDFNILINQLQLKSIEGFSMGTIRYSTGAMKGNIALKGTLEDPDVAGIINFENAGFNITALNNFFTVGNNSIGIDNGGIAFNKFIIKDTANNELKIDGRINSSNFQDFAFDLRIDGDNFQAMNTTKKDNKLFYGKLILTTAVQIKGTPENPIVDGSIVVNDKTRFTVVLPQTEPGVIEREGIVRFVDMDATPEDSLFLQVYDSLNVAPIQGFDITANIEIEKDAEFNLVVDEGNGDFIRIKGEALLTCGIDPSGKVTLVGSYELESGSYELTFNFLRRKFDIQKGSRIVWDGEPTSADIDVTAVYIANAAPYDLVQNQISRATNTIKNTYLQKLPFEVHLQMRGQLMSPVITFDIILPEDKNYGVSQDIENDVQTKLIQIRQEPSELNKQVFALLLLNRFVAENPFDNGGGSSFDAGLFARQSVSKLLTEQLNKLAGGLIAGVDINFDVATSDDFTTGTKRNRTDFNIGLTKRLLNERLTITVGSNFELEGPRRSTQQQSGLQGNVAIDYKLSRDGRYLLRVYRRNEYEGIVEGYVVETGIGFIVNADYNYIKELLIRSKPKKVKKADKTEPIPEPEKKTIGPNANDYFHD